MSYESARHQAEYNLLRLATTYGHTRNDKREVAREQAQATRGVGLAILALAEALRPAPAEVNVVVNTEDVKTAVVEALEGQR